MKIIDLLNKIANGEEVPLKIKIKGDMYRQSNGQFWCDETETYMIDNCTSICHLNDEVEILEEEKKIPEKLDWNKNDFTYPEGNLMSEETADMLMEVQDKVNFILDYLKSKGE